MRFAKSSKKRTSPGKRGRLITLPYLPWWKSEPNFENRLTPIISLSHDKSLAITQHGNADNGPPLIYIFGHVPLWLCEDITACCYMYCYFRNIFPPWSSQMTILLITSAMYQIRYKSGAYKFKRNHPPRIGYRGTSTITNRPNFGKTSH